MKKLNKRQIIILVVAALCVLYAVYELVIIGPAAKKVKTEAKLVARESIVNRLNSDLMKYAVAGADAYIVKRAEKDWTKNPFWDRSAYREYFGKEANSGLASKMTYSGYIDAGRRKMAIINGWEYEAGESIDIEGYMLKKRGPVEGFNFESQYG